MKIVELEEWVLVTGNAFEFRGRYRKLEVHPGIVFLNSGVRRRNQIELFSAALDAIAEEPDLTNFAMEAAYTGDQIRVSRYALP